MDNEFERNFIQSVKNDVSQQNFNKNQPKVANISTSSPDDSIKDIKPKKHINLSQIISLIAIVVVVIQSTIIIILLTNHSSLTNNTTTSNDDNNIEVEEGQGSVSSETYIFDDNDNLIALDFKCTIDDNSYYVLDKSNNITKWDKGSIVESGNYSIYNNNLIQTSFSNNNGNVLFYDGRYLADGITLYKCQENISESDT